MEGLQPATFIRDLKMDDTYTDSSFAREYESEWSGDSENAFFSSDKFDKQRVLAQPEDKASGRLTKSQYYILGVDVGRLNCTTEISVIKVAHPAENPFSIKSLVNIFTYDAEDFEVQAIQIKRLYNKFKARQVIIDANGLGVGLVDFMTKMQTDPDTGEILLPFGVSGGNNADAVEPYKKIKGPGIENDAMFLLKANTPLNTEMHTYVQTQLYGGRIKFLIDENQAKVKLMSTKVGQKMTPEQRADYLMPFTQTTLLKDQMLNLVQEREGANIILKQSNRDIKKDKFSSFEYGMYYVKLEEDRSKKRKTRDLSKMAYYN